MKLPPVETICMKRQILFSGKNISICHLLKILPRVLSITAICVFEFCEKMTSCAFGIWWFWINIANLVTTQNLWKSGKVFYQLFSYSQSPFYKVTLVFFNAGFFGKCIFTSSQDNHLVLYWFFQTFKHTQSTLFVPQYNNKILYKDNWTGTKCLLKRWQLIRNYAKTYLISQETRFRYLLELPQWGNSNKYPKNILNSKKNTCFYSFVLSY